MNDETQTQPTAEGLAKAADAVEADAVAKDAAENAEAERTVPRDVPEGGVQAEANQDQDPSGALNEDYRQGKPLGFGADEAVQIIRDLSSGAVSREQGRKWLEDRGL